MERNRHSPYRIKRIDKENPTVRTFTLEPNDVNWTAKPGNFAMVWIPGVSENPFSLADINPPKIMVKKLGDAESFTSQLFRKKEGDQLFIRGPYGNSFKDFYDPEKTSYVVSGGIGCAPLICFLKYVADPDNTKVMAGFRTREEVIWATAFPMGMDPMITTDDGSFGAKGFITEQLEDLEAAEGSQFFICGPEKMMETAAKKAMKYADPENIILSLDRYMKCGGYGICGHCEIRGSRHIYSVCMDGPVFTYKQLMEGDFGKKYRTRSGRKIRI
jgi:dihydroorotate dehydrogenase electron transfer subunit